MIIWIPDLRIPDRESSITYLDGEKEFSDGGYAIEDLTNRANLEVAYLLIFGELPNEAQYNKFLMISKKRICKLQYGAHSGWISKIGTSMGVLASLTSALISFNPKTVDLESEEEMHKAIVKIMAKFPVLTAWVFRKKKTKF